VIERCTLHALEALAEVAVRRQRAQLLLYHERRLYRLQLLSADASSARPTLEQRNRLKNSIRTPSARAAQIEPGGNGSRTLL
jgi:predicted nucleic acid-binding protein